MRLIDADALTEAIKEMIKKILPILILFAVAYNLLSVVFDGDVPPGGPVIFWELVCIYWRMRAK